MVNICNQEDGEPIRHYIEYIKKLSPDSLTRSRYLCEGMTQKIYNHLRYDVREGKVAVDWYRFTEAAQDAEWLCSLQRRKNNNWFTSKTYYDNPHGFMVDQDGFIKVYTDGACPGNGTPYAKGGIGVWFGIDNKWNVSAPLSRKDPATNNVAEIKAVIKALEIAKKLGVERVKIYTDSMYLINSVETWIFNWLRNGWRRSDGRCEIKHRQQYRELLEAMENMDIKWRHVEGHSGVHGNDMADWYAEKGAKRY